jgi:DNA-binding MarR family transcriptional regulator
VAPIDALQSPELSAILRLERDGPLNMRGFAVAAQVSPASARRVLKNLLGLKLVSVHKTRQGATQIAQIELTAAGKRVARHVAAIDALLPS